VINLAAHPNASASAQLAVEQICRWWCAVYNDLSVTEDETLVFAEDASSERAHVYAGPLPEVEHRLRPACSIVPGAAPGPSSRLDRHTSLGFACEARASTTVEALAMLRSLRRSIRRREEPFAAPHVRNIVGLPPVAQGSTLSAWRFLAIDVLAEPQILTLPNEPAPGGATSEGEASAAMTLIATAVPVTVEAAFTLRATNETFGPATIDFDAGFLFLGREPSAPGAEEITEMIMPEGLTIAQFVAAINAGTLTHGFVAEFAADFAASTPATALLGFFARTLAVDDSDVIAAWRN
jgi:hypothetical protein